MAVKGCTRCVKYLMFLFNGLILLAGLAAIGFGIAMVLMDQVMLEELLGTNLYTTGAYVVIAAGALTVLLTALACLGSIKEIRCMLITFFIALMLIFLVLFVGGILLYAFQDQVQSESKKLMTTSLRSTYGVRPELPEHRTATDLWDFAQQTFGCCAVEDWREWRNTTWHVENPARSVPDSCCLRRDDQCTDWDGLTPPAIQIIHTDGCFQQVYHLLSKNVAILCGVAVGVAVTLITGMVLAICLCKQIHEEP